MKCCRLPAISYLPNAAMSRGCEAAVALHGFVRLLLLALQHVVRQEAVAAPDPPVAKLQEVVPFEARESAFLLYLRSWSNPSRSKRAPPTKEVPQPTERKVPVP